MKHVVVNFKSNANQGDAIAESVEGRWFGSIHGDINLAHIEFPTENTDYLNEIAGSDDDVVSVQVVA